MSSGSYFPPPVRLVEIPEDDGGIRPLGIPTFAYRMAQTVVAMVLEPKVEPHFHSTRTAIGPGSPRSTPWERLSSDAVPPVSDLNAGNLEANRREIGMHGWSPKQP